MRKLILITLLGACGGSAAERSASAPECDVASVIRKLPAELAEVSGITVSRRWPGVLWIHNDDTPAILFAIDTTGTIKARVRVPNVDRLDWEDIASAPCDSGSCLYVGDIGDNQQRGSSRTVYRISEPSLSDTVAAQPIRYSFHMPDKSHDAEALAVLPDGRMYIVTKGRSGPITAYAFPHPLQPGMDVELRPIATLTAGLVQLPDMVTGASALDDRTIAIRTYSGLQFYRLENDQLTPLYEMPFDLRPLGEPQGEGIAVRQDGAVFLVSERSVEPAALLSRVKCKLP